MVRPARTGDTRCPTRTASRTLNLSHSGQTVVFKLRPHLAAGALLLLPTCDAAAQPGRRIEWPRLTTGVVVDTSIVPPTPRVRIGSAAGASHTLFYGIAGGSRLADGGVVVADAGNQRILNFDADGRFLSELGRPGDGPGEFRQPRWFGRCADRSLALHDGVHARLTFVTSDGRLEDSEALPAGANFDQVLWCSRGGRMFILLNRPREPLEKGTYPLIPTRLLRATRGRLDTVSRTGNQAFYIGRGVSALATVPLG